MTTEKKRRRAIVYAVALLALFVFAIALAFCSRDDGYADTDIIAEMTGGDYTLSQEDGADVWTASEKAGTQDLVSKTELSGYNKIHFSLRLNLYNGGEKRYTGLGIKLSETNELLFKIAPYDRTVTIESIDGSGAETVAVADKAYSSASAKRWHDVSLTFARFECVFEFDEVTVKYVLPDKPNSFYITASGVAPSVKDIKLSSVQTSTEGFSGIGFEEVTDGNDTVYTVTRADADKKYLFYNNDIGTDNLVKFDLRFGESYLGDAEAGVMLFADCGVKDEQIAFEILPYWKAVVIKHYAGGKQTGRLAEGNFKPAGALAIAWHTFSVTLMNGYLRVDCGADKVAECIIDEKYDFENAGFWFVDYLLTPSIKNIEHSAEGTGTTSLWIGSGFTFDEATGVYTAAANGDLKQLNRIGKTDPKHNAITFDLRPNEFQPYDTGNAGFIIDADDESGVEMFFDLMPKKGMARVRLIYKNNGVALGMYHYDGYENFNEWISIKCVFQQDLVLLYINGEMAVSSFNTRGYSFTASKCRMSTWMTGASFRNMEFSHEDINAETLNNVGYIDFDFTDENSLVALHTTTAEKHYNTERAADFTATDNSPAFSVALRQVPGGRYSAYLPVRNTMVVALRNNTSANTIGLDFTADDKGKTREYTKEFPVESNRDEYKAYYLNVSDLDPRGYLKDFTFTMKGARVGESFSIKTITFEREMPIYEYAASGAIRCVADIQADTVTVTGKVKPEYAGKKVAVTLDSVLNYDERISNVVLGDTVAAADGGFSISFALTQTNRSKYSHLGSFFLAYVENGDEKIKLSHRFNIENYKDFLDVDPVVDIADVRIDVTESSVGAHGDGFTDDTDAIQTAIDRVSASGGGKVVLPGDTSTQYGRRYIATNIKLKDNVDLVIETGATLWQSPRKDDYKYTPSYGHDALTDAVWPHCGVLSNYPLIEIRKCKNVRISGGGMIRMMDVGGEWLDGSIGFQAVDGHEIIIGCENRIHIAPIGMFDSHGVELSDISITRGGIWHIIVKHCSDMVFQNVHIYEAACLNTDGYSFDNTQRVTLFRCSLVSNDDAIVLNTVYRDFRDKTDWWWERKFGEDISVSDFLIVGNNLHGGLGLVFIPWGSENPDLSQAEIRNIEAYDNSFDGYQSVGCWPDNPSYGISQGVAYGGTLDDPPETDDYSPIKDVYLHDNFYISHFHDLSWNGNYEKMRVAATNFVNDIGIVGTTQFVNASFERNLRYDNETEWVSGLAYWSSETENGTVGYEQRGVKHKTAKYTGNEHDVKDYAGYVSGKARLYQGIHLNKGAYKLTASIKNPDGVGYFFAGDPLTKEIFFEAKLGSSDDFDEREIYFNAPENGVIAVGVLCKGADGQKLWIDDVAVSPCSDSFVGCGEKLQIDFSAEECGFTSYPEDGGRVENGMFTTSADGEYAFMLNNKGAISEFDASVDIEFGAAEATAGMFAFASVEKDTLAVSGINVRVVANDGQYKVVAVRYDAGATTVLAESENASLSSSRMTLRVTATGEQLSVFTGDATPMLTVSAAGLSGNIGLSSLNSQASFDNFVLLSGMYEKGMPALTEKPIAPDNPGVDDDSLNLGLAVGLPVGIVALAAIVLATVLIMRKKRNK